MLCSVDVTGAQMWPDLTWGAATCIRLRTSIYAMENSSRREKEKLKVLYARIRKSHISDVVVGGATASAQVMEMRIFYHIFL